VTRDEILAVYNAGPDAVITLVEGLIAKFEGRIAAFEHIYQLNGMIKVDLTEQPVKRIRRAAAK
jgi:hypothetical protein